MGSGSVSGVEELQLGIIPRAVSHIFDRVQAGSVTEDCTLRVSYLEIYNEEVKDLLHPRSPSKAIMIREDSAGDIFVHGERSCELACDHGCSDLPP